MNNIKVSNANTKLFLVTENAAGLLYTINAAADELIDDWNGPCEYVPANDARVFFASVDNDPVNPYLYTDFESLVQLLLERGIHAAEEKEEPLPVIWDTAPEWKEFQEKWGDAPDRDLMDGESERAYVNDLYEAYEKSGFVPFFCASDSDKAHNGESFAVIGRVSVDDPAWDLESIPAWNIRFESGEEFVAFPDEICFAEIFPHLSKELLQHLSVVLEDDNTENGGTSHNNETVMEFLLDLDDGIVTDLETLNLVLEACGIKQIESA